MIKELEKQSYEEKVNKLRLLIRRKRGLRGDIVIVFPDLKGSYREDRGTNLQKVGLEDFQRSLSA